MRIFFVFVSLMLSHNVISFPLTWNDTEGPMAHHPTTTTSDEITQGLKITLIAVLGVCCLGILSGLRRLHCPTRRERMQALTHQRGAEALDPITEELLLLKSSPEDHR